MCIRDSIWAVGGVAVMALALLLAVILNSGIRFKKFFRAVIYMPNIISAVALATMWLQYVYNPRFGLLTTFFNSIGLTSLASVQWTDTVHKFWALLGAYCFGMVGYHMLIFSSGIEKIPAEYYEASTIDGAGQLGQFPVSYTHLDVYKRQLHSRTAYVHSDNAAHGIPPLFLLPL